MYVCICTVFWSPGGFLDFWNGGADMLTWGRRNYLRSEISRYQKCCMCSEIWAGLISWGLIFLVCHGPRHFLSFNFRTAQLIISCVNHLGSDDEEIKVLGKTHKSIFSRKASFGRLGDGGVCRWTF